MMDVDNSISGLFQLLDDWRRLTHAETEAIRSEDWNKMELISDRKTYLQKAIQRLNEAVFEGSSLEPGRRAIEKTRVREMALELKRLEIQNRDLLMRRLELLDEQLRAGNRTISGLRGVQKAYRIEPSPLWQKLS